MEDNREVLIRESEQLNMLVKAMLSKAKLNYRKDGFDFDDEVLDALLRGIAPELYANTLNVLTGKE